MSEKIKESLTPDEAILILKKETEKIENWKIVFAFKRMKVKPIYTASIELMKACIVLHNNGLPILTGLLSEIMNKSASTIGMSLHILGDKKCLIFKRGVNRAYGRNEWMLNPLFMRGVSQNEF